MGKTKRELFFYDIDGEPIDIDNDNDWRCTVATSEVRLPAPSKSKKVVGKCSFRYSLITDTVKVGDVVDIAVGDPIVLRGCELLSRGKSRIPNKVWEEMGFCADDILTFRYKRYGVDGRIWVYCHDACLLSDLERDADG